MEEAKKYGPVTIYGDIPSKANSYKIITLGNHGSLSKTEAAKTYERNFYMQCPLRDLNLTCRFKLDVDVFYGSDRKDLDNAFKMMLDAMQMAHIIKNDRQCVEIHARKMIDKKEPRIIFSIEEVVGT